MKVIGYIRVSTEEQATGGVSLDAQRKKLEAYAALYHLELVDACPPRPFGRGNRGDYLPRGRGGVRRVRRRFGAAVTARQRRRPIGRRREQRGPMSGNESTDWGTELKKAIAASGRSINELAKAAGIAQPILQRFVSGAQESIRLDTANKLGDVLGLRIVAVKPVQRRKA
jgi:DNA-binding Xre family transcriptional regulator